MTDSDDDRAINEAIRNRDRLWCITLIEVLDIEAMHDVLAAFNQRRPLDTNLKYIQHSGERHQFRQQAIGDYCAICGNSWEHKSHAP